jgi:hypothetical protein
MWWWYLPEGGKVEAGVACGNAKETSSGGKSKYEGIFTFLSSVTTNHHNIQFKALINKTTIARFLIINN